MCFHQCWQSFENGRFCFCKEKKKEPINLKQSKLFLNLHSGLSDMELLPHVNTRWSHSDSKSYSSSLKLRRDPWINKFLVACRQEKHNVTQNRKQKISSFIRVAKVNNILGSSGCCSLTLFSSFSRKTETLGWCFCWRSAYLSNTTIDSSPHLTTDCSHWCITCPPPPSLVCARPLLRNLTWIGRKFFVSEESWQPFIKSNTLCKNEEMLKVSAVSLIWNKLNLWQQ